MDLVLKLKKSTKLINITLYKEFPSNSHFFSLSKDTILNEDEILILHLKSYIVDIVERQNAFNKIRQVVKGELNYKERHKL